MTDRATEGAHAICEEANWDSSLIAELAAQARAERDRYRSAIEVHREAARNYLTPSDNEALWAVLDVDA